MKNRRLFVVLCTVTSCMQLPCMNDNGLPLYECVDTDFFDYLTTDEGSQPPSFFATYIEKTQYYNTLIDHYNVCIQTLNNYATDGWEYKEKISTDFPKNLIDEVTNLIETSKKLKNEIFQLNQYIQVLQASKEKNFFHNLPNSDANDPLVTNFL